MSGTAKTVTALNTEFADAGLPGRLAPADVRNVVASFVPWDDPTNAKSLGIPAIIRKTVSADQVTNVTMGAGQSTGTRQATAVALQAAINSCITNGYFFEIPPGIYEIDTTTPITIINSTFTNQFVWRGSPMTRLIQFNQSGTGVPVLQFGDSVSSVYSYNVDFRGVSAEYGNSQAGKTTSTNVYVGGISSSNISMVRAGAGSNAFPAYNGVLFDGSFNAFSCSFNDWDVNGAQVNMCNFNKLSTGNVFSNWYVNIGNDATVITGAYITMGAGQQFSEQDFNEINCEHGTCNTIVNIQQAQGVTFRHLHIESVVMTGANPRCVFINGHNVHFDNVMIENVSFLTPAVSGNCSIFDDYAPGRSISRVNNLQFYYFTAGLVNTSVAIHQTDGLPAGVTGTFSIDGFMCQDNGNGPGTNMLTRLLLDSHMPVASFVPPELFERYSYGIKGSRVEKASINIAAAYTHYGQHEDATLVLAATGSYTVNLAATMGATGTQKPRTGNTVTFLRPTYTSGTVTIQNAGGALTTNVSTTSVFCQFDGTNWVTFTPVT